MAKTELKCFKCGGQAYRYLKEGRWFVNCLTCGYHGHLKVAAKK